MIAPTPPAPQKILTWAEVAALDPIWLNLGGKSHCHPHPQYQGYVAVDLRPGNGWCVVHDLTRPIPLPANSVDRIHSEDFFHYLTRPQMVAILRECHRLLKPGCRLRLCVPDYGNPKNRHALALGKDPDYPLHLVLTDIDEMKSILAETPFTHLEFLHYWEGDTFVEHPIDLGLGMVQRTPDTDPRNRRTNWRWKFRNALFRLSHGWKLSNLDRCFLRGYRLHVTSLVVDCIK